MEQPYVYAYPLDTAPSAPPLPEGSGFAGVMVDPRFCAPYPVDLAIVRKMTKFPDGNLVITDVNGNLLFKVKEPVFGLGDKILLDGSGTPILTLRAKMVSLQDRWQVFRGGSTEQRDLLYTLKRSSMLQLRTKLDVFLSDNKEEKSCDFHVKVKGSCLERSCVFYAGESDAILAQKHTVQRVFFGKNNFSVTVYPNVDYAFIVSLLVILDEQTHMFLF